MTISDKSSFPTEIFAKFYIEDHVTCDLFESSIFKFFLGTFMILNRENNLSHFILDSISPKAVAILFVDSIGFVNRFGNTNTILVCSIPVFGLNTTKNNFAFTLNMSNPPSECRLIIDTIIGGVICKLNRVGILEVFEFNPLSRAIFPKDKQLPAFSLIFTTLYSLLGITERIFFRNSFISTYVVNDVIK